MLLIAGGARDPNLRGLIEHADARGHPVYPLLVGRDSLPGVSWDLIDDRLIIDDECIRPTSIFLRYDVFEDIDAARAETRHAATAWHATISGWLQAHPRVWVFNQGVARDGLAKPAVLHHAIQHGLLCPQTVVSNEMSKLAELPSDQGFIAKPVAGGSYCQSLESATEDGEVRAGRAAAPAIVQERVDGADLRIYRVGRRFLSYALLSSELDYRTDDECVIQPRPNASVAAEYFTRLWALTEQLGLDFCAADFKICDQSGDLYFLELNSSPMFAAFDAVDDGAISSAILDCLT